MEISFQRSVLVIGKVVKSICFLRYCKFNVVESVIFFLSDYTVKLFTSDNLFRESVSDENYFSSPTKRNLIVLHKHGYIDNKIALISFTGLQSRLSLNQLHN